jgi:hypothetical protein
MKWAYQPDAVLATAVEGSFLYVALHLGPSLLSFLRSDPKGGPLPWGQAKCRC